MFKFNISRLLIGNQARVNKIVYYLRCFASVGKLPSGSRTLHPRQALPRRVIDHVYEMGIPLDLTL